MSKAVKLAPGTLAVAVIIFAGIIYKFIESRFLDRIESLEAIIRLKDEKISDYKDKLDGASPDEAKARIDTLELRLAAMQPRRLTSKQREKMAHALTRAERATVRITYDDHLEEVRTIALSLIASFKLHEWTVVAGHTYVDDDGAAEYEPASGLHLLAVNPFALRPAGLAVQSALTSAGLKFEVGEYAALKEDVGLAVSQRR